MIRRVLVSLVALVVGSGPVLLAAPIQTVPEPALRAAFILNFVKLTEWPADVLPPEAPLQVCVMDAEVADELRAAIADRHVVGRPVSVLLVSPVRVPQSCLVVYTGATPATMLRGLLTELRRSGILTVGDDGEFTRNGGIIRLFIESGQMRFSINVTAAERAGLRLSSRLLSLAQIARE